MLAAFEFIRAFVAKNNTCQNVTYLQAKCYEGIPTTLKLWKPRKIPAKIYTDNLLNFF